MPPVELHASLTYNITTFSILKFGRAMAINISHWFLVRSQTLAGTHRFLAGLFTLWPTVNQLRASVTTGENVSFLHCLLQGKNVSFLHCLSQYHAELQNVVMRSCLQMNGGKLVMWLETEADSELSLISLKF